MSATFARPPSLNMAAAWAAHASALAAWVMSHLVNRTDVWGLYQHWCDDKGNEHHVMTAPARRHRGRELLTVDIIARHFRGQRYGVIIGVHSTSEVNTCWWMAVDVDCHDDDPEGLKAACNWAAALAWFTRLTEMGFHVLLEDSNGRGGFHLWVLFDAALPAEHAFAFAQSVIADYQAYGLTAPPETFPKQSRLDAGRPGNWLRLPGKHPTRRHWSRFWAGDCWVEGEDAVAWMLSTQRSSAALVPEPLAIPTTPIDLAHTDIAVVHRALGRGRITAHELVTANNSSACGVRITMQLTEQVDRGQWLASPDLTLSGTFWLMRKDGTVIDKVLDMLMQSTRWDGDLLETLQSGSEWKSASCQAVVVMDDTGELRLAWLRPWDAPLRSPIESYLAKLPTGLTAGEGRSNHAYRFAAFMINDVGIADEKALEWLERWNALQATQLTEDKLRQTITNAHLYARGARRSE